MNAFQTAPRSARPRMRRWLKCLPMALAALWGAAPLGLLGMAPPAYAAADLTVKVYDDAGRDGVDTAASETGIAGVQVALYNTDNNPAGLINTNASGLAVFPALPSGDYRIEVSNIGARVVSVPGALDTNPGLVTRV